MRSARGPSRATNASIRASSSSRPRISESTPLHYALAIGILGRGVHFFWRECAGGELMAEPTREQIEAVRDVLYKRARSRQILDDARSIDRLMKVDAGLGGPVWRLPATGSPSAGVREAVQRTERIAAAYRAMSREIARLELPARDKRSLRTALDEQAAVWELRGSVWAAPGKPDVNAIVNKLNSHHRGVLEAARKVPEYFRGGRVRP